MTFKKEPWEGSFDLQPQPRVWRRRLFLLSAFLFFVLAYFVMAPDAPNLPLSPEQSESTGRTAY
jgi:hypothetical protein